MNRRGFLGLLGKLVAVGVAMGVAPEILRPVKNHLVVDPSGHGDFVDVQSAVAALPAEGGTILLRDGVYALSDFLNIGKTVRVRGASTR